MAGYLEITSNGVSYKGNNPSSKSWEDVIKPDPTILDVSLGNDDIIHYPTFVSDNSGNLPLYVDKSDTAMSYKPSTGELTATTFIGDLEGIAASATRLETARTIGGVSFDGTADIVLPGVNSAGNQNTSGIAASATRLETARNINGVLFDGNADIVLPEPVKIDISNNNTSNTFYPTFASSTGSQTLYVDNTGSQMSYKPSTGELTATTFVGNLKGNKIDATSTTSGVIELATKNGTAGSGAGLILTGNTLIDENLSLCLTINGVKYKIPMIPNQ
jgi:hypothetical protein